MATRTILVVGGTSGIGAEMSRSFSGRGDRVILTGRDRERAEQIASSIGVAAQGLALDLAQPEAVADALSGVGEVHGVVLAGVERGSMTIGSFDIAAATRLATLKLVGYAEVIHALGDRLVRSADTGVVLFGGIARYRPYPGSLAVSTVNGGIEGLSVALSVDLAPIRVNVLHPGIIGDSPFWADKEQALVQYRTRTPGGELAAMADVVDATRFLLENRGVSGAELHVNRGTLAS
ncbi:SDR family oxidoreductase [Microbacterium sp. HMH0099]|uniref:SDR family oxidoreductase n=1 Tax=Microbacterium sp. HMH0099 TaxID=3414026 RepID=UPI003BF66C63